MSLKTKNYLYVEVFSKDIAIFNSDNYEIINTIKNCHDGNIRGISLLNDELIISGSEVKKTKIWEISS